MLVLKRRRGESIIIDDQIEICFLDGERQTARLAIRAPRKVAVHRKEVYLAIQRENLTAASSSDRGLSLPRGAAAHLAAAPTSVPRPVRCVVRRSDSRAERADTARHG